MTEPTPVLNLRVETVRSEESQGWVLESYPQARRKLDELFLHWLSLPDTGKLIQGYIDDVRDGRPIDVPHSPPSKGHLSPRVKSLQLSRSSGQGALSPPPCSPRRADHRARAEGIGLASPRSPRQLPLSPPVSPARTALGAKSPTSPARMPPAEVANRFHKGLPRDRDHAADSMHAHATAVAEAKGSGGADGDGAGADAVLLPADADADADTPMVDAEPLEGDADATLKHSPPKMTAVAAQAQAPTPTQDMSHMIKPFWKPGQGGSCGRGRGPIASDALEQRQHEIDQLFAGHAHGLCVDDFVAATKDLCGFPSFFNAPLFQRIRLLFADAAEDEAARRHAEAKAAGGVCGDGTGGAGGHATPDTPSAQLVTRGAFCRFWRAEIEPYDTLERFFRLVKQPNAAGIVKEDFMPYLEELLTYHPGLEFLENTPEFQEKYALTVVVRIYYVVNKSHSGCITLRELRRSNVVDLFTVVDEEEDINKVTEYFSYEHFYVLYCKFWELDTDHDFSISPDDLMKYDHHSLTREIIDLAFARGVRPFGRMQGGAQERATMGFEDFVYFMLSEEDKTNEQSLRYWFRCVDMDDDGRITSADCRFLYEPQLDRMQCLGHETVPFEDIMCQLCDMLKPEVDGEIRLRHFLNPERINIAGVFFDALFNLNKFIRFEQRDPFQMRQQQQAQQQPGAPKTAWDLFACQEYSRLAMEEEQREEEAALETAGGGQGQWGDQGDGPAEAPF